MSFVRGLGRREVVQQIWVVEIALWRVPRLLLQQGKLLLLHDLLLLRLHHLELSLEIVLFHH